MRLPYSRSARARLALLLTLAFVPIGAIALYQSREVADQAREMSERALLGETLRAAAAQREVIRTTQGQARALVPLVRDIAQVPERCSELMARLVEGAAPLEFAGYATADGRLECTSNGSRTDLRDTDLKDVLEGGAKVSASKQDAPLGAADLGGGLLVIQPVLGGGPRDGSGRLKPQTIGTILLVLPARALMSGDLIPGETDPPLELTTFNRTGEILWSSPRAPGATLGSAEAAQMAHLPAELPLADFIGQPASARTAQSVDGHRRAFAVVPVVEGEVMMLGTWQPGSLFADPGSRPLTLGVLLPLAMWALSLGVAFIAVNRMILEPLGTLRARMLAFTAGARTLPPFRLTRAPEELRELADSFDAMTTRIVTNETRLEKSVQDQRVLLKEVHHRVKNNLQLIASILNMQIRQHRDTASRAVLRRVHDRVMSMATVHQQLYRTSALSALQADELLSEIINRRLAEASALLDGVQVDIDLRPVRLYPDQALPLALFAGEALSNILLHLGRPADGQRPWLSVRLGCTDDRRVVLELANSGGPRLREEQKEQRAGLGMRLMAGFATQLEGEIDKTEGDAEGAPWRIKLSFAPASFTDGEDVPLPDGEGVPL